ncbi:hypothetical protein [uncultured Thiothrix sp.]|uniref:hypothetical protein n=1 Tax=uncultured Thiothrix sp. TaxID=223185 RepID=UPI002608C015|nr:hypothetical protein [uncultured Thiothrix sp.]HMT93636.1 hypothetical protein [Thiolinea sp.]
MDILDKAITHSGRAGSSIERVGKMLMADVCPEAIAAQMRHNSPNGYKYTKKDIETIERIFADTKTAVLITKKQAKGLIQAADKKEESPNGAMPA